MSHLLLPLLRGTVVEKGLATMSRINIIVLMVRMGIILFICCLIIIVVFSSYGSIITQPTITVRIKKRRPTIQNVHSYYL